MKKELPINLNTIYKTYPYNAFYIGILEANHVNTEDIIIKNFLNIFSYTTNHTFKIDLYGSGKINKYGFNVFYFPTENISIKFIINSINNNNYLFVLLNEHYINNINIHQNNDYCHDWLIYGYNDYTQEFLCAGYIGSDIRKRVFKSIKLSFQEVEIAMKKVTSSYLKSKPNSFRNHYFNYNSNYNYVIDEKEIKKSLHNLFFNQKFEKIKYKNLKCSYNSRAIEKFIKNFQKDYIKNNKSIIRLENLGIYYEHKQTLFLVLKKISTNKSDIKTYEMVVDNTYTCLLMALKYNLTRNKTIALKIYNILQTNYKKEREIFLKYL